LSSDDKRPSTELDDNSETPYWEDPDYERMSRAWSLVGGYEATQRGADDRPHAEDEYRTALAIFQELNFARPNNIRLQGGRSVAHEKIGDAQRAHDNLADALVNYQAALAIQEHLASIDDDADRQETLSALHTKIGDVQGAQGNWSAALASYQIAFSIAERLALIAAYSEFTSNVAKWRQRDLASLYTRIGDAQRAQGNLPAAVVSYQDAVAIRKHLAEIDPHGKRAEIHLGAVFEKLGTAQQELGDLRAALISYRAGVAIAESLAKAMPREAELQHDLIQARQRLINLQTQLSARQNSGSVSEQDVQNRPVPRETTSTDQERGSLGSSQRLPLLDTSRELTRPAETAALCLAQATDIPIEAARKIVTATAKKPDEMRAASEKLLRAPKRFVSRADITDDDLNNPAVLRAHIDFAKLHKNTNPTMLDDDQAYKLRKSRLVRKYDIDRRHKLQH